MKNWRIKFEIEKRHCPFASNKSNMSQQKLADTQEIRKEKKSAFFREIKRNDNVSDENVSHLLVIILTLEAIEAEMEDTPKQ